MRTLESLAVHNEPKTPIRPQTAWTDLYIYPGFQFKVVDVLLTNLHRPRSSHIVFMAAFAGKDLATRSYAEILEKGGYEFDMFGDSMLILAAQARSWCASVTGRFATQHYMVGVRRAVVSDRPLVLLTAW